MLEHQFEVEPHQTTLSVDCCLIPLCLGINTIELRGVFDVRCTLRGNFLVKRWSQPMLPSSGEVQRGITGVFMAIGLQFSPGTTSAYYS